MASLRCGRPGLTFGPVKAWILLIVLLSVVAGNVSAAIHAHSSDGEAVVVCGQVTDTHSGHDHSTAPSCESCTHALSHVLHRGAPVTHVTFATVRNVVPADTSAASSWHVSPADKPPKA